MQFTNLSLIPRLFLLAHSNVHMTFELHIFAEFKGHGYIIVQGGKAWVRGYPNLSCRDSQRERVSLRSAMGSQPSHENRQCKNTLPVNSCLLEPFLLDPQTVGVMMVKVCVVMVVMVCVVMVVMMVKVCVVMVVRMVMVCVVRGKSPLTIVVWTQSTE